MSNNEIENLKAKIARYEERLEIDHAYLGKEMVRYEIPEAERETFPDAVYCRDVEIKHLEQTIKEMSAVVVMAGELMDFIMQKYKVTSKENLTCPFHRDLYDALEKLGKFDK